jgi:2,3-bisphosphoglycerate-independent phosphoglycerate mutase
MKRLIIVPDGMADHPLAALGNKTPLAYARTPVMDRLAAEGSCGRFITVPEGMEPGSEVANMAIMGYEPDLYFCNRGPLEAASMGVELKPGEIALRCNLIHTVNGRILSHSGGDLEPEEAEEVILALNSMTEKGDVRFYQGVSYRHILVLRHHSAGIQCFPPHNHLGSLTGELKILPQGEDPEEKETADLLNSLAAKSAGVLQGIPWIREKARNGERFPGMIWPWAPGEAPAFPTLMERTGLTGGVISAVDLIKGLGIYAGLEVIPVDGATGNSFTNYEGKAMAALEALRGLDFVYLHIEAPDEAGHDGDMELKIKTIEDIDRRLLKPLIAEVEKTGMDIRIALLPDHPTPVEVRTHIREPVPVLIWGNGAGRDDVVEFSEEAVFKGRLGTFTPTSFFRDFFF